MSLLQVEQFWLINLNPTQATYIMGATFVELPPFERHRAQYFNDEEFRGFQRLLLKQPDAGAVIQGTGGLRKVRFADSSRQQARWAACHLLPLGSRQPLLVVRRVWKGRAGRSERRAEESAQAHVKY